MIPPNLNIHNPNPKAQTPQQDIHVHGVCGLRGDKALGLGAAFGSGNPKLSTLAATGLGLVGLSELSGFWGLTGFSGLTRDCRVYSAY